MYIAVHTNLEGRRFTYHSGKVTCFARLCESRSFDEQAIMSRKRHGSTAVRSHKRPSITFMKLYCIRRAATTSSVRIREKEDKTYEGDGENQLEKETDDSSRHRSVHIKYGETTPRQFVLIEVHSKTLRFVNAYICKKQFFKLHYINSKLLRPYVFVLQTLGINSFCMC